MNWVSTDATSSGYGVPIVAPTDGLETDCVKREEVSTDISPGSTWTKTVDGYDEEIITEGTGTGTGETYSAPGYVESGYIEGGSCQQEEQYVADGYVASGYVEGQEAPDGYYKSGYVSAGYAEGDTQSAPKYVADGYVADGYVEGSRTSAPKYMADGYVADGYVEGGEPVCTIGTPDVITHVWHPAVWERWVLDPVITPYVHSAYFESDVVSVGCHPYKEAKLDPFEEMYLLFPFGDTVAGLLKNKQLSSEFGLRMSIQDRADLGERVLEGAV